ncbi:lethal(2) giant larvae protein homolog 1-like isoform X3 [Amphibalanus amphitrite]|uniref:lethal(2) giant larvae protein homolog 1-like isoform X3 n=1 Tax=Amphibalanus amphitrite TaxID=1232801 RepID=UPI001C901214|nr:lethal(2) giant larvae protein homolog 1-like isoform X3 [Amphibalanus amphitrite]
MFKFMHKKHPVPAERLRHQKELFRYAKTAQHGFPSKPSALAYDPTLSLMAIGTKSGAINVYGQPGVEFYGQHKNVESAVRQIIFLPNQGRLVTHCDDNTLHLWEVNFRSGTSVLEEVNSTTMEGKLKTISTCCLEASGEHLLVGTEGGNIYLLNIASFSLTDNIIYQDVVMQNVPDDYKVTPGAVECVRQHPVFPDKILIGYNRGLMVVWDRKQLNAERVGIWDRKLVHGEQTYVCNQSLETVCWSRDGAEFMSAHNDGSFIIWNARKLSKPDGPHAPYGPFPCKSMTRVSWVTTDSGDWVVFSGGMPRASYGDKHTVSVLKRDAQREEEKHVAFDFTSAVVDFVLLGGEGTESKEGPHTLLVLAEEELVAVDLSSEGWPTHQLPYLSSLHSSAITTASYVTDCSETAYRRLVAAGERQRQPASQKPWPITGGERVGEPCSSRDLLLTGHEDGSVCVWAAGDVSLRLIYRLTTSRLFSEEEDDRDRRERELDEEFPPLRSVGVFDPYSDDPRLAVKRVALCGDSAALVVAGTAGQIVVWRLAEEEKEGYKVQPVLVDLVSEQDSFAWKGHDRLPARPEPLTLPAGYQPSSVIQLHPPAAVSALSLQDSWGLLAAGTGHGFVLFDFIQNKPVMHKCTLNPHDYAASGESPMTRGKSLKKSLRESFRRLRKGRSQRAAGPRRASPSPAGGQTPTTATDSPAAPQHARRGLSPPVTVSDDDVRPVERSVEARSEDPAFSGMIRCLYLATSYLASGQPPMRTLWAGTNSGAIYVYAVHCAAGEKRITTPVTWQPGKEFRLKHGAPVIDIRIVDAGGRSVCRAPADQAATGPHRVVIASEEQFKVFTLPTMRPYGKFKLTAVEGSRVRRIGYARFCASPTDDSAYTEWCLMCVTNQGDINVFTLPELRRQMHEESIRREDILSVRAGLRAASSLSLPLRAASAGFRRRFRSLSGRGRPPPGTASLALIRGITSLVFTEHGEALYLASSSLYQRLALSSGVAVRPSCRLTLPEGARPAAGAAAPAAGAAAPAAAAAPATDESAEAKQRTASGDSRPAAEASFSSGADTTVDSHRDFLSSSEKPIESAAAATSGAAGGGDGSGPGEPEVVEISTEEADRLLNGMRGLVNGVGGREERSVENYKEEKDGVKKSLEKSKETHISASEDEQNNVTAQREETERVLTTTESTSDSVTTRSKEEVRVVRTTRITAGTKVTEVTPPATTAAAAATTAGTRQNGNGGPDVTGVHRGRQAARADHGTVRDPGALRE